MTEQLLTVPEAATRLHCKPETIRSLVRKGTLRATKPAGRWLVPESALTDLLTAATNVTPVRRRRRRAA